MLVYHIYILGTNILILGTIFFVSYHHYWDNKTILFFDIYRNMHFCCYCSYIFVALLLLDLFLVQPQETKQINSLSPQLKEKLTDIISFLITLRDGKEIEREVGNTNTLNTIRDETEKEKKKSAQNIQYPSISTCPKQDPQNVLSLMKDYPNSFDNEWTETGAVVLPKLKLVVCSMPKSGCTTAKWLILALLGFERREKFCLEDIEDLHSAHK